MKNNYQEAQDEFDEITKGLSPEEKMQTKKVMVEMQKKLVLKEPWLIRDWPKNDRDKFLQQYTDEEQERMAKRIELELQHQKDKKKGFG
tara:strand:- start:153 stop:419 length:267 start_codon:yes stop_codon:yes gene_type:complete